MSLSGLTDHKSLYNSIIIDNYIKLIRKKYNFINIEDLLNYAGMTSYQVEDEGHWFTQREINLFYEKVYQLTGNKDIAREAGAYSASPDTLGIIRRYTLSLLGPIKVYEMLERWSKKFTRSAKYKSKKISSNKIEIVVTPHDGTKEEPFQCENRIGYLEGISRLFEDKPPKVIHSECLFKGDECCRYIVTFPESRFDLWLKIRWLTGLILVFFCTVNLNNTSKWNEYYETIVPCIIIFLSVGWFSEFLFRKKLLRYLDTIKDTSEDLIQQKNVNYNNALLVKETGKILCNQSDIDGILAKVISVLEKRLDYSRALILLANSDKTRLMPCAGFGHNEEQILLVKEWPGFNLDRENSKGVFVVSFREKKPFLINDFSQIKEEHSQRSKDFADKMGIKSFICCPVFFENESLGILAVDNVKSGRPLLQCDINLLTGVAQQIGIALHSVNLECKLRHSQKIEAVGTLAKGFAHDFNNIMTAVLSYSDKAMLEASNGQSINKSIGKIQQAGFRALDLVKQISTFSREIEQDRKLLNLPELINESLGLLKATLPDNITTRINMSNDCRQIFGDETHLYQVIMNLCINAIQAMTPSGGVLEINLKTRKLSTSDLMTYPDLLAGDYIQMEVSDTGHGMNSETMARIFEPYFTTKEREKGTGIGLSVVHGIVTKHGGSISVESKLGRGTTFKILFPDSKIQEVLDKKATERLPRGTESVLVIDDERFFADLIKNMLDKLGYNVTVSTDSLVAFADFQKKPDIYDLVITDYSMPKMNGLTFAQKIRDIKPTIPIILCTGFSESVSREIALDAGVNYYFQKPVLQNDLAVTIYKIFNDGDMKQYIF